jgi:16S rRNA processing protein RimM
MELIEIGRIVRSHGLEGTMKVLSYLETPGVLPGISEFFIGRSSGEAVSLPMEAVRPGSGSFFLKLKGVDDRDGAERFRGFKVFISSERMPKLPDGEYYWHEVVGLEVVTEDERVLGRIESVFPTGSNDVYVCRSEGREILLPAIAEVVRSIDRERRVMVVRLLKGLES